MPSSVGWSSTPAAPGAANTRTFFSHCFGRAVRRIGCMVGRSGRNASERLVHPVRMVGPGEHLTVAGRVAVGVQRARRHDPSPLSDSQASRRRTFSGPRQLAPSSRPVHMPSSTCETGREDLDRVPVAGQHVGDHTHVLLVAGRHDRRRGGPDRDATAGAPSCRPGGRDSAICTPQALAAASTSVALRPGRTRSRGERTQSIPIATGRRSAGAGASAGAATERSDPSS